MIAAILIILLLYLAYHIIKGYLIGLAIAIPIGIAVIIWYLKKTK